MLGLALLTFCKVFESDTSEDLISWIWRESNHLVFFIFSFTSRPIALKPTITKAKITALAPNPSASKTFCEVQTQWWTVQSCYWKSGQQCWKLNGHRASTRTATFGLSGHRESTKAEPTCLIWNKGVLLTNEITLIPLMFSWPKVWTSLISPRNLVSQWKSCGYLFHKLISKSLCSCWMPSVHRIYSYLFVLCEVVELCWFAKWPVLKLAAQLGNTSGPVPFIE